MKRFPIVPAPRAAGGFTLGVTMPPAGGGGKMSIFLALCTTALKREDRILIYAIYNLPEGAAVEWTVAGGHAQVESPLNARVLILQFIDPDPVGGLVSAKVNGVDIGSVPYVGGLEC